MLSLLFKEELSLDEDTTLLEEFKDYPLKFEHDIGNIDTKLSVYLGNKKLAQEKVDKLKREGFKFIGHIHDGVPFFHDAFASKDEPIAEEVIAETIETENDSVAGNASETSMASDTGTTSEQSFAVPEPAIRVETKPCMNQFNTQKVSSTPPPPSLESSFVTKDAFEQLKKSAELQFNNFADNLMRRVETMEALSTQPSNSSSLNHDHVYTNSSNQTIKSSPMTTEFKAKNELIANGVRCEKCNVVVKGVEPITRLIMAIRDHVIDHFDKENPNLKRLGCSQCPDFFTNMIDDFERHLKRHGSMVSVTERRQQLCVNLLTETHLKLICQLSNECFPEVFETTPPAMNSIKAVDTPIRAKTSVFPRLDRIYCTRFHIPYAACGRSSLPVPLVKID